MPPWLVREAPPISGVRAKPPSLFLTRSCAHQCFPPCKKKGKDLRLCFPRLAGVAASLSPSGSVGSPPHGPGLVPPSPPPLLVSCPGAFFFQKHFAVMAMRTPPPPCVFVVQRATTCALSSEYKDDLGTVVTLERNALKQELWAYVVWRVGGIAPLANSCRAHTCLEGCSCDAWMAHCVTLVHGRDQLNFVSMQAPGTRLPADPAEKGRAFGAMARLVDVFLVPLGRMLFQRPPTL